MKLHHPHHALPTLHKWIGLIAAAALLLVLSGVAGWLAWQRTRPVRVADTPLSDKTATPLAATKDRDLQKDLQDLARNIEAYDSEDRTFAENVQKNAPESLATQKAIAAEVESRIQTLQGVVVRIDQATALSEAYKNSLHVQASQEIKTLESLAPDIAAATSSEMMAAVSGRVATEFQAYAFCVSQADMLRLIDRQLVIIDKGDALVTKLQARIDQAQKAAQDTAAVSQSLLRLQQYAGNARQQTQTVELGAGSLLPVNLAADRQTFARLHDALRDAHNETMAAVSAAREIAVLLAKMPAP